MCGPEWLKQVVQIAHSNVLGVEALGGVIPKVMMTKLVGRRNERAAGSLSPV